MLHYHCLAAFLLNVVETAPELQEPKHIFCRVVVWIGHFSDDLSSPAKGRSRRLPSTLALGGHMIITLTSPVQGRRFRRTRHKFSTVRGRSVVTLVIHWPAMSNVQRYCEPNALLSDEAPGRCELAVTNVS